MDKVGEYKYKTKLDEDWKTVWERKNWSFNRSSANDRLIDQLQKQPKFIPQSFCEFYEDVRADTDAQTNDISSGSGKPSCKPYWGS